MKPEDSSSEDYSRPVAYDVDGRPLYAHPPDNLQAKSVPLSQVVHMMRPNEPVKPFISDATQIKHEQSKKLYPALNLSEGEYVISAVRRHMIGLCIPFSLGVLGLAVTLSLLFNYDILVQMLSLTGSLANPSIGAIFLILVAILIGFGCYAAHYIFTRNRFFLTNESVIQETQMSLLAHHGQTVSLANIEDASYEQGGILQQLFGYGSIRLSTQGDETTYRLTYVANPKQHIATLNDAVEAFKNGRPIVNN